MKLDIDVLEETFALYLQLVLFRAFSRLCGVVLQLSVYVKLSRNQSWANLLLSVLQNSILDLILDRLSLFSILYLLYM